MSAGVVKERILLLERVACQAACWTAFLLILNLCMLEEHKECVPISLGKYRALSLFLPPVACKLNWEQTITDWYRKIHNRNDRMIKTMAISELFQLFRALPIWPPFLFFFSLLGSVWLWGTLQMVFKQIFLCSIWIFLAFHQNEKYYWRTILLRWIFQLTVYIIPITASGKKRSARSFRKCKLQLTRIIDTPGLPFLCGQLGVLEQHKIL